MSTVDGVAVRLPGEESQRRKQAALATGKLQIEEATYQMLLS